MDERRVEGDAIGIECDCRELEIQGVVVPLIITDLGRSVRAGAPQGLVLQGLAPVLPQVLETGHSYASPVLSAGLPTQLKE